MAASKIITRMLIMGAPAAGKGTVASRIVKDFGFAHLSAGDVLRDNVRRETGICFKILGGLLGNR